MRVPFAVFTALLLLPAAAQAQVVIQDQAETFLAERSAYLAESATKPEKWWAGDVSDMPQMANVNMPAMNVDGMQPLFSYEAMMNAQQQTSNPAANQPVPSLPTGDAPALPGSPQAQPDDAAANGGGMGLVIPGIPTAPIAQPPLADAAAAASVPTDSAAPEDMLAAPAPAPQIPSLPPPEDAANAIDVTNQTEGDELAPANPTLTP